MFSCASGWSCYTFPCLKHSCRTNTCPALSHDKRQLTGHPAYPRNTFLTSQDLTWCIQSYLRWNFFDQPNLNPDVFFSEMATFGHHIMCPFFMRSMYICCIYSRVVFFLSGPPTIQYWSLNESLSTPSVGTQNGPLKPPLTRLGLHVPNLHILHIWDIPGMTTSSIMLFHNHVSKLVHWFLDASQGQQIWARGLIFVEYRNTL